MNTVKIFTDSKQAAWNTVRGILKHMVIDVQFTKDTGKTVWVEEFPFDEHNVQMAYDEGGYIEVVTNNADFIHIYYEKAN